jgi:hypothetical protein
MHQLCQDYNRLSWKNRLLHPHNPHYSILPDLGDNMLQHLKLILSALSKSDIAPSKSSFSYLATPPS